MITFQECDCKLDDDFEFVADKVPDCPRAWEIYHQGNTTGIFQVESHLGKEYSKKVKPDNIKELSDLIAIIRPGAKEVTMDDGKSITEHYVLRKSGKEQSTQKIEALKPLLEDDFQLNLYQESALKIVSEIAGFSLCESETLRKAIGKKDPELMTKVKKQIVEGCINTGKVNEQEANEIADGIQRACRYQFNKSHSIAYAQNSYFSAYAKSHFPLYFYKSYLNHTRDEQKPLEDLRELIFDANFNGVKINPPDLRKLNPEFIIESGEIYFGLNYIKNMGDACIRDLNKINTKTPIVKMNWCELLFFVLDKLNKTCSKHLISSGALRYLGLDREFMLYEYDHMTKLTKTERTRALDILNPRHYLNLQQFLEAILELGTGKGKVIATRPRQNVIQGILASLRAPSFGLSDTPRQVIAYEETVLGLPMSVGPGDERVLADSYKCLDLVKKIAPTGTTINVCGRIENIKVINTKNNKTMCFLTVYDDTYVYPNVTVFTNQWEEYKHILQTQKDYIFTGKLDKRPSFIIDQIEILS